jgi:hypothetical protein
MLISETMQTKTAVATIALAGTWKRGLTLRDAKFVSMLRNSHLESTHGSKPLGEWQPIIAREGEHLARARSQSTDGDHDQQNQDDADEACRTTYALSGVLEDVDERVARCMPKRFFDVADAECIAATGELWRRLEPGLVHLRDQQKKCKRHVEQERYTVQDNPHVSDVLRRTVGPSKLTPSPWAQWYLHSRPLRPYGRRCLDQAPRTYLIP